MMAALVAEAPERVVYPRRAAMVEAGAERAVLEEDLAYQRRAGTGGLGGGAGGAGGAGGCGVPASGAGCC